MSTNPARPARGDDPYATAGYTSPQGTGEAMQEDIQILVYGVGTLCLLAFVHLQVSAWLVKAGCARSISLALGGERRASPYRHLPG
ncbi:hypothetical protein SNK04_014139 [Fusarium graminearum]